MLRTSMIVLIVTSFTLTLFSDTFAQSSNATATRDRFWINLWMAGRYPKLTERSSSWRRQKDIDWDYRTRAELDEQSEKYVRHLEQDGAFLDNPQLHDYLTQMLHKVTGHEPIDGRPGNPSIRLLKCQAPNAFALNNGVIFVTTGMLSIIRSEDELIGVLAHEMAHIVLDHNLINYNSAKSNEALAQFIGTAASLAAGVAAAKYGGDMTSYVDRKAYIQDAMLVAGTFSYAITSGVLEIIGASYSRSQEEKADIAARDFLVALGVNPHQYGDLLSRLGEYHRLKGLSNGSSLLDDHPTIQSRLETLEYNPKQTTPRQIDAYDRNISFCLNYNARILISENKHDAALQDLDRVIRSGFAGEETYLLKARVLRHLASDSMTNYEALRNLELSSKFKTIGFNVANLERGLLFVRLNEYANAETSFQAYLAGLTEDKNSDMEEQITFAKEMIFRCRMGAHFINSKRTE